MKIINTTASIPYPPLLNWDKPAPPDGWAQFPEEFYDIFYPPNKQAAGFVDITVEDKAIPIPSDLETDKDGIPGLLVVKAVTACTWNEEAYQAFLAKLPDPLEGAKSAKLSELSEACNAAIVAGMDVETSQGAEHFSLEETDQINLTTALSAVQSGAEGYPYHADGRLCRMFTAAEIQAIAAASVQHKLYHTTLCNHLLTWARRAESAEELASITYSADGLPEDLAANMAAILAAAGGAYV